MNIHAADTSDPGQTRIVYAFLDRDAADYSIVETWDTLGMRATQSHDTILDGAFVADEHVARVVAEGFAGADLFVLGIFESAWDPRRLHTLEVRMEHDHEAPRPEEVPARAA